MSFRKRSEIIGNGVPVVGSRAPPGATPLNSLTTGSNISSRSPAVSGRGPNPLTRQAGVLPQRGSIGNKAPTTGTSSLETRILNHPGVKPSLITSLPTVSTGTPDLDKILLHQGLPLGNSLLIEELGTTDFASILLRVFASQGIVHNRCLENKKELNTHVVVIGQSIQWAKDLPAVYQGSKKEQQKAKIIANESKLSISNLSNTTSQRDMKIAWRYGLNKKKDDQEEKELDNNDNYSHQFDITSKLIPTPGSQEITFLPISKETINQLTKVIEMHTKQEKVIRIVIPGFLHPSLYGPEFCSPFKVLPFIQSLVSLVKKNASNVVLMMSLSTQLYPRTNHITMNISRLMDGVVELQQFNQEMMNTIEKSYKNEPTKIQHGLVHIYKIPVLSDRGLMTVHNGEYAFKNGKKKFEIEEWGIPVEDDSKEESQTTKDIEF